MCAKRKIADGHRKFNPESTEKYFFVEVKDKAVSFAKVELLLETAVITKGSMLQNNPLLQFGNL